MPAKGMKFGQSKYQETMPQELIDLFTKGKDRENFCSKHNISGITSDQWLSKHKDFSDAYVIAKQKAKQWFNDLAQKHLVEEHEGPKLNTKLWSMMMRNRFELTEHRKLKMLGLDKAKSFADQMKVVMNELAQGNLTGSEAQQIAKLIETGVNVYEATELEKRVAEIEKANRIGVSDSEFKEEADGSDSSEAKD